MSNNRKTPPISSGIYFVGPNGELYHHGIKGQKWGIRRYQNPDGSLTDAGKKRLYKDVQKAHDRDNWGHEHYDKLSRNKMIRNMHESLKEKRAECEEADYLSNEFQSNEALYNKYLKKAHAADAKEMGMDPDNMNDIKDLATYYMDGNMDVFEGGKAFRLYLTDKGVDPDSYLKNVHAAQKRYSDAVDKYVDDMLGRTGDAAIFTKNSYSTTYKSAVSSALDSMAVKERERKLLYGHGYEV